MIDVSEPERDEVGDVPAAHEVHDPLVGEGVRLGAAVVIWKAVLSSIEQPHAGTLSQAGPHDNNKDQFESGSKMQKLVLSMP